ncbi:DUF4236 domain-containing protein [Aristaeella lactis]|uniref:Uncharacterized protein n=1 Tax=Aristaeella lactis TaxID=3046383 RepID=A0AC61PLL3_9FIRM|nr:DUF4236 domain-containing protein [Aristaeella lactis]QUA54660.1 DUF4236 domain-containing protein [Aristaeella lactis]SMC63738.1 Protein of unknown function [Aristaeella lactis]
MGMRFRRSVKILPGVRINFSKSGMSTTIGPKGASINIGKNGTYLNTGIPGTGLYMREKIGGGKTTTRQASSSGRGKGYDPEFLRRYEQYKPVIIKINGSGKITIEDKNGDVITDEFFLKKMKATSDFKAQKEQLISQWREKGEQEYREAENALAELVNIHHYSFTVKTMEDYEHELAAIPHKEYQKKAFDQKEPSRHEIETSLTTYASLHVTSKAFWRVKKLRAEYVAENLELQYQKQHAEWEKKKQEFEQQQNKEAETQNAIYIREYEKACATMKEKMAGSDEYVKKHLETWLSSSTLPVEVNVDYEYEADTGNMYIDLLLPPESVIPKQAITRLANGGVKEKDKSRTTIQTEYAEMVFGLGICITSGVFDISPAIKRILTSGFATRRDKEGNEVDECLYSIKYERTGFENVPLRQQNPIEFIGRFENRYKATQTWAFKAIKPFDDF